MNGSWRVVPAGPAPPGRPWLVIRGGSHEAVLRGGAVLELTDRGTRNLGPDILDDPPDVDAMVARLRVVDARRELGEALLDQRLVAGIGNVWRAEALWEARVSPWRRLAETDDDELRAVLDAAAGLMRASLRGLRRERRAYRRAGRPCARCGTSIASRGQGDDNRIAYWCPSCQPTPERPK